MAVPLELPTLPAAHARALGMLSDPDAGPADLAPVIETDPALTASMLRAANSAAYGWLTRTGTTTDAIVRIGLSVTRRVVAGSVIGSGFANLSRSGLDVDELWRHVVACALLAEGACTLIADAPGDGVRSEAFTAGMLHDVGRLAMAAQDPVAYLRVVQLVRDGVEPEAAESEVFGRSHVDWGVDIGEAWRFPESVVDAIANHHAGDARALAWATWQSRRVAWSLGIGDGLTVPDEVSFDSDSGDAAIVAAAGGVENLTSKIEWYGEALGLAA